MQRNSAPGVGRWLHSWKHCCPSEGLSSVPSNYDRDAKIFFNTPAPGPCIPLPQHCYLVGSIQCTYLHVDICAST